MVHWRQFAMSCRNAAQGAGRSGYKNFPVLKDYHAERTYGSSDYIYDLLQRVSAVQYLFVTRDSGHAKMALAQRS